MTTSDERQKVLADKVEKLRKDRGSSKRHIYTAAGMSPVTYDGRIEGRTDFKFRELISIADALGVEVSELVSTDEGSTDGKTRV